MTDYRQLEQQLSSDLGLTRRPIAIAFRDAPPAGVSPFAGTAPSGCTFWRLASEGRTFFTVPSDHYNCAIGSYTHNIPLPAERAKELEDTLGFMIGIGYVRMEEVPGIPVLPKTPGAVVYAPLGDTPVDPDVVLFWGPAARVGNRVYTGVEEGELYAAVPGKDLMKLAETASTISSANATLLEYHQGRRQQLSTQP